MSNTIRREPVTDEDVRCKFDGNIIATEFFGIMCGKFLGGGVGRGVYELSTDSELVIKVETRGQSFQNVLEWEIWEDLSVSNPATARWFSPCHMISSCGRVMIQSRTRLINKEFFPEKMPSFFSDLKYQNFGMLEGQIVAHDYGYSNLISLGATSRMRKADWQDDNAEDD